MIAWFLKIYISPGGISRGGIFNSHVIATFPKSMYVKKLLKLVNIWRRYGQKVVGTFFMAHSVVVDHVRKYGAVNGQNKYWTNRIFLRLIVINVFFRL